ncbi:formylglycine-generating enzyme family protein [Brevundimonas goettingensis]|uniref:Formylglycine-generating enzyme family protein n=1 Tax=Brevundimonas goettingensis TaxID=2774190 RepID=A0A975GUI6_9CAUL|nr:formylglycine-generating enzyme family protein [Brevundimonas goettingensis]QTC90161.1 formylglycine-generating enzyme family protein [Brevundimonas goettingensis]
MIRWLALPVALCLMAAVQETESARPLALNEVLVGDLTDQSQYRAGLIGTGAYYECFRIPVTPRQWYRANVEADFRAFVSTSRRGCFDNALGTTLQISDRQNVDISFSPSMAEVFLTVYASSKGPGRFVVSVVELTEPRPRPGARTSSAPYASIGASSWGEGGVIRGVAGGAGGALTGTASTVAELKAPREPGEIFADCDTACPSMVVVPAGTFMMGSPPTEANREASEGPRHVVTIQQPFAVGRYEVTFEEYDACVAARGCDRKEDNGWGRGRRPAVNITYRDAQRYVAWLSQTTGERYFIPSEAEWEYVARAGTSTPWNTGTAVIADDANILNQFGKTVVVGGYAPNAFGLYDTIGNVAEWTQDCIDTGYIGAPNDGSAATSGDCETRSVIRGADLASPSNTARSAARTPARRAGPAPNTGLRIARAL